MVDPWYYPVNLRKIKFHLSDESRITLMAVIFGSGTSSMPKIGLDTGGQMDLRLPPSLPQSHIFIG